MDSILKIAVGVFIGGLAAMFTWEGVHLAVAKYELIRAADAMRRSIGEARKREAESERQRVEDEMARRARDAAAEREAAAAGLERERVRAAREAAWKRFYTPSAACQADGSTMECANAFMRAKKDFERLYPQ